MKTIAAPVVAKMKAVARLRHAEFVSYSFTERERRALEPFFSNVHRRVFFIHGLPTVVATSLLAMYSRLKNPRGLRGHFVDHLVPLLMFAPAYAEGDSAAPPWKVVQASFRKRGLTSLDAICEADNDYQTGLEQFIANASDPEYWATIADSDRINDFLQMYLDDYGHRSIARTGQVVLAVEDCSVLTAKSLEWARPGAGYIELSTRYVDFSGKALYPAWEEVALIDAVAADRLRSNAEEGIRLYREFMGQSVDGPFPTFLRERYGSVIGDPKILEQSVLGESCDVLGNLLPCATLTQVGMGLSGEALPQVLKHLALDGTPENLALVDAIIAEAGPAGVRNFIRHWKPTPWERENWLFLRQQSHADSILPKCEQSARTILAALDVLPGVHPIYATTLFEDIFPAPREEYDKLPRAFESVSAMFDSIMSFRGWRDVQRQGFCMHQRALVTPELGFYIYPKVAPPELIDAFRSVHGANRSLWEAGKDDGVPLTMLQYGMAMGNLIRYQIAANLREWEFCNWQRTKWAVNDEVRAQFLATEYALRSEYPWWKRLSRADLTRHYVFARGARIPLE